MRRIKLGRTLGCSLGCVVLAVVLATWGLGRYWLQRPVGSGPAGPPVPREPFRQAWTTRPVELVGLGDSVTAGFGASDKAHSYFGRLLRNPADDAADVRGLCLSAVLPNLHARNLAVHGTTSIEHLAGQLPRLPPFPRRVLGVVVMSTGGNDIIHNYGQTPPREGAMYGATLRQSEPWIRAFEGRLDRMVTALEARFPGGCHIFLADIYDPTDGVGTAFTVGLPRWPDSIRILSAYNAALRRCAARHASVHLVPVHDAFLGHGIYCRQFWRPTYRQEDPHYWYAPNFEDPNDRGYDALRRLFLREMARVLAPNPP